VTESRELTDSDLEAVAAGKGAALPAVGVGLSGFNALMWVAYMRRQKSGVAK
jgi:hypothetical protein